MAVELYPHQKQVLEATKGKNRVGYFVEMGLGKTHISSEKMTDLGEVKNLVVCQKSKIEDWVMHFLENYPQYEVHDLTLLGGIQSFLESDNLRVGVINYELLFRRPEILETDIGTLVLDESSLIQNESAKRSKAVLEMDAKNVVLLSGTVVNGRYERLWSQCNLLGWKIGKKTFWNHYVVQEKFEDDYGYVRFKTVGYKNIERLKRKLREYGGIFMKTEEVYELPPQNFINVNVEPSKEYRKFLKNRIIEIEDQTLVGDMLLTDRLYQRMLCGMFSKEKLKAFEDLLESTSDRLIVFYNFTGELTKLQALAEKHEKPISVVNGEKRDLTAYNEREDSVTFVQYQAGAMGLNLQKSNKIVYFTLPEGNSEGFEQSKKRTHRIGQDRPCFYYVMTCEGTIEEEIKINLGIKKSRIDNLFAEEK